MFAGPQSNCLLQETCSSATVTCIDFIMCSLTQSTVPSQFASTFMNMIASWLSSGWEKERKHYFIANRRTRDGCECIGGLLGVQCNLFQAATLGGRLKEIRSYNIRVCFGIGQKNCGHSTEVAA